jgi:hypothetical protein
MQVRRGKLKKKGQKDIKGSSGVNIGLSLEGII